MAKNSPSPLEELKNLLEDLQAKKPRESLRMPTRATRRALLQADFTPREPDQKTIERHLRAIYREELADLFEKACRRLLFENEVLARDIYDDRTEGVRPISHSDWEAAARSALDTIPQGALEDDPLATVRLLLGHHELTMTEVARVGRELRPLPAFDIYSGLDAMARGELRTAESVLHGVYDGSPIESARQDAACNLGEALHLQGDHPAAVARWYRVNSESGQVWTLSPVFWLFNSILSADPSECEMAAAVLSEHQPHPDLLADCIRRLRAEGYAGTWSPGRGARSLAQSSRLSGSEAVEHVKELFV